MHERFARRVKAVRSRPRRAGLWVAGLALLTATVIYFVGFAPVFVLKNVDVTGGSAEVEALAIEHAEAPIGVPLARVDTEAMSGRVAADSRIKQVTVSRDWPSSVVVEVTMRTPAAVLKQPGQPLRLVDATGVAFEEVSQRPDDLPQIRAARGDIDPDSLAGAVAARTALGEPFSENVSSMTVTSDGDLRFSVGVIDVTWGRPQEAKLKAAATRALLAQDTIDPEGEEEMTIDVTSPQAPVVTGLPLLP
ncbi:MAG: FtsQ-type POTRA domain-containing protein [Ornithinimicrobium sp.]